MKNTIKVFVLVALTLAASLQQGNTGTVCSGLSV